MIEDVKKNRARAWRKFAVRHKKMIGLWIILGIMFAAGAVYVFMDFAADAQASAMVPASLGGWSVGHIFTFVINLLFWEALMIGIPLVITIVAIYMLWWKSIPLHEREEYGRAKLFHSSEGFKGSSGFSIFFYILIMIKVYLDGNWNLPISQWSFDYLIGSVLWILIVVAVLVGIPMLLGGLWYFSTLKEEDMDKERPCKIPPYRSKNRHDYEVTTEPVPKV
ncbi:MAG: hypothetical protein QCI38_09120, partial [Candidatus Thermoplasmatota archaeon]|nr:hypothetical protein [Candidatus Thermoplasmatota archaeon]